MSAYHVAGLVLVLLGVCLYVVHWADEQRREDRAAWKRIEAVMDPPTEDDPSWSAWVAQQRREEQ